MKQIETIIKSKDYSTITFDQLAEQLNLDDDLVVVEQLESMLKAAIDWVETRTNSYITPTILEYTDYEFTGDTVELEHKAVNNITSLKINDVEIIDYRIIRKYTSTYLILKQSVNITSVLSVSYEAGKTPVNSAIQAALITAADLYDVDRSNYSAGVINNKTVLRLLNLE